MVVSLVLQHHLLKVLKTFRKGKVHLVAEALVAAAVIEEAVAEDVVLLPQEKEHEQRQGILGRLFHMFGGGAAADHDD
jgi:hypothetical protein